MVRKFFGDGGYRSPYLSHAKRALYHLSYVPSHYWERLNEQGLADRQVAIPSQLIRAISAFCNTDTCHTFDSSVGRAVDCSCTLSEIHRSLVQIRLEGGNFSFQQKLSQTVSKAPTRLTHVSKLQTNSVWRIFLQFGRQE